MIDLLDNAGVKEVCQDLERGVAVRVAEDASLGLEVHDIDFGVDVDALHVWAVAAQVECVRLETNLSGFRVNMEDGWRASACFEMVVLAGDLVFAKDAHHDTFLIGNDRPDLLTQLSWEVCEGFELNAAGK